MPRPKPLTQAQKIQEANEKRRRAIAEGLAIYKSRRNCTNAELACELGIGRNTIIHILQGDEVKLETDKHFRVLEASGYVMRKRVSEPQEL